VKNGYYRSVLSLFHILQVVSYKLAVVVKADYRLSLTLNLEFSFSVWGLHIDLLLLIGYFDSLILGFFHKLYSQL
jgi:hypothetical protein